jgi:hypothetical protein
MVPQILIDQDRGRAREVWAEAAHTVDSKILGPHFETLATEWVTRYARDEAGLEIGLTGQASTASMRCTDRITGAHRYPGRMVAWKADGTGRM